MVRGRQWAADGVGGAGRDADEGGGVGAVGGPRMKRGRVGASDSM